MLFRYMPRVYVAYVSTSLPVTRKTTLQARYFLGIALRKQLRYAEAATHLEKALEAANEAGDSIKDEVWREMAACKYSWWLQEATVRRDKQDRLKGRLNLFMDAYYMANSSVCCHQVSCATVCLCRQVPECLTALSLLE